ncbi:hypothetical protein EI94DRAFT_1746649 [Lactarius quietus]|nr:hypothetical protein EI94DRAFT_1746649 [Lactarius quietus]
MPISIPTGTLSYLLLLVGSARAQISAPNCTNDTFAWTFNSLQQNPCLVMAYLIGASNNGTFVIPALKQGASYPAPSNGGGSCYCNTVAYNLFSACDACQGSSWMPYSQWASNCSINATAGTFPEPVPADTRVPRWAYNNSTDGDNWNMSLAQFVGDSPEVTGTFSIIPTSTRTATPSTSSSPHSTSSSPYSTSSSSLNTSSSSISTPHQTSKTGVIAGGVVAGTIGAALITGVVLWFAFRRQRVRCVTVMGEKELPPLQPLAEEARLYDPSDPTTFPGREYLPQSDKHLGSTSRKQPNDRGYTGLPEV